MRPLTPRQRKRLYLLLEIMGHFCIHSAGFLLVLYTGDLKALQASISLSALLWCAIHVTRMQRKLLATLRRNDEQQGGAR